MPCNLQKLCHIIIKFILYLSFFVGIDVDVDVETSDKTPETEDQGKQAEGQGQGRRCQGRGGWRGRGGQGCPRGRGRQGPGFGPWGMWDWGMGPHCPPGAGPHCPPGAGPWGKCGMKGKNKGGAEKEAPKEPQPSNSMETETPKPNEKSAPSPDKMVRFVSNVYILSLSQTLISQSAVLYVSKSYFQHISHFSLHFTSCLVKPLVPQSKFSGTRKFTMRVSVLRDELRL